MAISKSELVVPNLPNLSPSWLSSPYTGNWWTTNVIEEIPVAAVEWMLAQGWRITEVAYDDSTTPPTPSYTMTRQVMQNWMILQGLMNQLTGAYNEANAHNQWRYDAVVSDWVEMLSASRVDVWEAIDERNTNLSLYLSNLSSYMDDVETEADAIKSIAADAVDKVSTQLVAYLAKLDDLESNYSGHLATLETILASQSAALLAFLSDYEARLASLSTDYSTHEAAITALETTSSSELATHVTTYTGLLTQLLTDYNTHASTVSDLEASTESALSALSVQANALLSLMLADYNSLADDIDTILDSADSALTAHDASASAILALLLSDYTSHETTAEAFLVDLGSTELARINEAFDARLAEASQNLVDRGFYSSGLAEDYDERIERDRDEAISALNDKLAREKLENEHQLYQQQVGVRMQTLAGEDRLHSLQQEILRYKSESLSRRYAQLQQVRDRTLTTRETLYQLQAQFDNWSVTVETGLQSRLADVRARTLDGNDRIQALRDALVRWKTDNEYKLGAELANIRLKRMEASDREHQAKQDVYRNEAAQRDKLYQFLQASVAALLDGKQQYNSQQLQSTTFLTEMRYRLCAKKMEANLQRLQGRLTVDERQQELVRYMVSTRNDILVGLFGFEERRTDKGPDLSEIAQLVVSLGDSGATSWVTP